MKTNHTGFCMGTFDSEKCHDCPCLKECIILACKELAIMMTSACKISRKDFKNDS